VAASSIVIDYTIKDKELKENNKLLEDVQENLEGVQGEVDGANRKLKEQQKELASSNKALAGLGGQLKATANNIKIMGVGLGDLTTKSVESVRGIGGMVTALKTFKIALAATGIGLLLVALGSLVAFFTKTQRGIDMANKAFAAIGATVSVFTDRLSMLGENLIKLNFKGILSTFSGITKEIKDEASAAITLEGAMQRVVKAEIDLGVNRSKTMAQIKELNLFVEDTTKSTEARAEAAKKAIQLEKDMLAAEIALQTEKLEIIKAQNNLGESLNADLEKAAEAEEKLNNLKAASNELQTTLNNKLNGLEAQGVAIAAQKLAANEKIALELKKQNEELEILIEKEKEFASLLQSIPPPISEISKGIMDGVASSLDKAKESLALFHAEYVDKQQDRAEKDAQIDEARQASNELVTQGIQTASDIRVNNLQRELQDLETQKEIELQLAGDNEERKAAIERKFAAESAKIKEKQFKADRVAALSKTGFNIATAITQALPNIPLSIIVGAIGALQVASILSQPIPKFEKGGLIGGKRHSAGGTMLEAESGEYILNRKAVEKYGIRNIEKINSMDFNPNLMVVNDNKDLLKALTDKPNVSLNWDENGFTSYMNRKNHKITRKQKRFSMA
jgi:DNA repair exonuclease SbcCD ATPase subunit